jgi:transcriptional regulator with XRE-family HTH domain
MSSFTSRFEALIALEEARLGTTLSNRDIARMTGGVISSSYVHRLRTGDLTNPSLTTLYALAKAFDVDPGVLLNEEKSERAQTAMIAARIQKLAARDLSVSELLEIIETALKNRGTDD